VSLYEYYETYWESDAPPPLADPLSSRRLSLLRSVLRADDRRILDAGSGSGWLVGQLAGDGAEATGIDISKRAIELARECHPSASFIRHSVEELPWPIEERSQDVVTAFEVVEHLLRPRALIEGACQTLRTGGHLAMSTPYHGRAKNVAVSLFAFDHHFAPEGDHIRFFTDAALRQLLTSNGFEVELIRHLGRFAPLWAGVFVWARKR
jgi:2-polyprenyl-6-hydroxyphenyl methylase/3-demethylubiquinone-9 3-methyltransferase